MPIPIVITAGSKTKNLIPDGIKPADNALDSEKSGRDNSSGLMFRDKIAEKLKYTVDMPAGMTSEEVKDILEIILATQFSATVPNPKTGAFNSKSFYCSSAEPEIEQILPNGTWIYKAWSFNMTEM